MFSNEDDDIFNLNRLAGQLQGVLRAAPCQRQPRLLQRNADEAGILIIYGTLKPYKGVTPAFESAFGSRMNSKFVTSSKTVYTPVARLLFRSGLEIGRAHV